MLNPKKVKGKMMRSELKNMMLAASLIFTAVLVILYFLSNYYNFEYTGILYAGLLSYVNFITGLSVLTSALRKPGSQFMIMAFGSMTVRLFVIIGLVVLGLLLYKFDRFLFVFVFFGFYFIFLIVEIFFLLYIQKKIKSEKKS